MQTLQPNRFQLRRRIVLKGLFLPLFLFFIIGKSFSQMVICEIPNISNIRMFNATSDTIMLHITPKPIFASFDLAPPYQLLYPGDTALLASLEWAGAFKAPAEVFDFVWVSGYADREVNEQGNWAFEQRSDHQGEYLFTISHFVYADRPNFRHYKPVAPSPVIPEDTSVYAMYQLEKEAGYPGGMAQLSVDLNMHFANRTGFYELRSYYEFVIEKNGSASHFKVLKGRDEIIHERVKTFVEKALWTPGIHKGKPVRSKFVLPVSVSR